MRPHILATRDASSELGDFAPSPHTFQVLSDELAHLDPYEIADN
jgi:hypothetical protein